MGGVGRSVVVVVGGIGVCVVVVVEGGPTILCKSENLIFCEELGELNLMNSV